MASLPCRWVSIDVARGRHRGPHRLARCQWPVTSPRSALANCWCRRGAVRAPRQTGRHPVSHGAGQVIAVGEVCGGHDPDARGATALCPQWLDGPLRAVLSATIGASSTARSPNSPFCRSKPFSPSPKQLSNAPAATLRRAALSTLIPHRAGIQPCHVVLTTGAGRVSSLSRVQQTGGRPCRTGPGSGRFTRSGWA